MLPQNQLLYNADDLVQVYNLKYMIHSRTILNELFSAGIAAADPYKLVIGAEAAVSSRFRDEDYRSLLIAGFGKAASAMAVAAEEVFGELLDSGIVITKYGYSGLDGPKKVRLYEAGHPVPDKNGLIATRELMDLVRRRSRETFILCLISGGGSSLLVAPYHGISLEEKQKTTELLLRSGADINEVNAVRKHISLIKGGRLAGIAYPAGITSLIISDVVGDRIDVIASGPTSPDNSTFGEAFGVIRKYGLSDRIPAAVRALLLNGTEGSVPETPKPSDNVFGRAEWIVIGNNRTALEAVRTKAEKAGFLVILNEKSVTGEAWEAGKRLGQNAKDIKKKSGSGRPVCLVSGGETTVTVKGDGTGGRNMELALGFAIAVGGEDGITLLSAGTDGIDGATDAAGAFADGETLQRARQAGVDPEDCLVRNDSYNFFTKTGDLFITGPTGTNVMDMQIVLMR